MNIDIEQKSNELKSFVSQFDTKIFMGDLSTMLMMVPMINIPGSLQGLIAPQRQLFYLAGLHLSSIKDDDSQTKYQWTEEEWDYIKDLLIEIETGYEQNFFPDEETVLNDLEKEQRLVSLIYHLNYFNQGELNYEEQIIERIQIYFAPFDDEIKNHFGLRIAEFISIYLFLDELLHQKLNSVFPKADEPRMEEIGIDAFVEGIMNPNKMHLAVPPSYMRMSQNMVDPGLKYRFTLKELEKEYDIDTIEAFIAALSFQRSKTPFLYYTESNPYTNQPIFQVSDDEYQSIDIKQIINGIYIQIFNFVTSHESLTEPFYKHRGNELENKIVCLFKSILGDSAFIHQSYYTELGNEQDILILYKGLALIIEAKASKRRQPRSDPNKAFGLIKQNFDKVIQKGYDQTFRVKKKFLKKEKVILYEDQGLTREIVTLNSKNYHHVYSVIVTLERFGQIQTDLDIMLNIDDEDEFPLSICLDDLEVFLLAFKKRGSNFKDILRYFDLRENLHGGLICGDELEICGAIIDKQIPDEKLKSDEIIRTHPDHAQMFDDYYHNGLGFENEINLERKTSGKFHTMFR